MNKPNPITFAALGLVLAGAVHAQEPRAKIDLARVRSTFSAADKDRSGTLDSKEVAAAGIPAKDFRGQDLDGNSVLSGDEFVTYYRTLLVRAGRTVNKDIETEVARIQAARRTQEAKDAAKKDAAKQDAAKQDAVRPADRKPATTGPGAGRRGSTDERLQRAKAALDGKRDDVRVEKTAAPSADEVKSQAERVQAARNEKTAERVQDARDARTAERVQDARDAQGAQPAPQMTAEQRAAKLRDEKAASDAQRAADMRAKLADAKLADQEPAKQPAPVVGETPARRAQQYVKRLVDQGRLSPERARDFYTLLNAEPDAAGQAPEGQKAAGPAELRAALKRAKPRIGELVEQGFLTATEGRELSSALDARATAAAKAASAKDEPAKGEPATPEREKAADSKEGPANARRVQQARAGEQREARNEAGEGKQPKTGDADPQRAPAVKKKRDAVKPKPKVKDRKPQGEGRRNGRDD